MLLLMRLSLLILLASLASPFIAAPARAQVPYVSRVADGNRMGVTLTNYGGIGNNFVSRSPSMEFPLGSGFEHLTHGGLWIGAQTADANGLFTGVTTAALDGSTGTSTQGLSEFTPSGLAIQLRSNLPTSQFYSMSAVSAWDMVSAFHDSIAKRSDYNSEVHRPLRVSVRQESYQFQNTPVRDVLFLRYVITALGPEPLRNAWAGLYTEFASGNKSASAVWPPTGWFRKKWIQSDTAPPMLREHYCLSQPVPQSCQVQAVPYWVGSAVLTTPDPALGQQVTVSAWPYGPGSSLRDQDTERYALISTGVIQPLTGDSLMPSTGDPTELIALGPFPMIAAGDSITVDFALVGGAEIVDIDATASTAQQFAASGFEIATPVRVSLATSRAETGRVTLDWFAGVRAGEMVVERNRDGAWNSIATISPDGAGHLRYDDRDVVAGTRYGYRLSAGGATFGEAWVDVPVATLALFGAPRVVAGTTHVPVDFALGSSTAARLELVDVAGRRISSRAVGALGAGRHTVDLTAAARIEPGIYFLRLTQAERTVTARVVAVP